jgi:hypothetical protein
VRVESRTIGTSMRPAITDPREVAPVRELERAIDYSRAAEPDIQSMRGRDQRAESGGVSTGNAALAGLQIHFAAMVFSHSVSATRPVVEKSVKTPSVPKSKYALYSALGSPL